MPAKSKHTNPTARKPKVTAAAIPAGSDKNSRNARFYLLKSAITDKLAEMGKREVVNKQLNAPILITAKSVSETAFHASKDRRSTMAALRFDYVLENAKLIKAGIPPKKNSNQKKFIEMMEMHCKMGRVYPKKNIVAKLMVGISFNNRAKKQYCITAIRT